MESFITICNLVHLYLIVLLFVTVAEKCIVRQWPSMAQTKE